MSAPLFVPPLVGKRVRIESMRGGHVSALVEAANEGRESYGFTTVPADEVSMSSHVAGLLAEAALGECVPFVQIDSESSRVVGATRFLTVRRRPEFATPYAVEIGGTWLAASAQRSGINTEAKLLLLMFAFETWGVERVDLKTDARNERSRTAIERIGASFEGVLRRWQPSHVWGEDDVCRDTAMFSIVRDEWPSVKSRLTGLVA